VGSYWSLRAGRRTLAWGKNYAPDPLALLFTGQELELQLSGLDEDNVDEDFDWSSVPRDQFIYRSRVLDIRDRLTLQGFSPDAVYQVAFDYLDKVLADSDAPTPYSTEDARAAYGDTETFMSAIVQRAWQSESLPPTTSSRELLDSAFNDLRECFDDPRFAVALLIRGVRSNVAVNFDLSDCLMSGYLVASERPHLTARARLDGGVGSSGSIIVVTEGSSDAKLLEHSLRLARPGVAHMFEFMNFAATSAAGGVEQAVKLTRSMAAARVLNRVICVLDNDGAGRDGVATLERSNLPPHFSVRVLPDVAVARSYPVETPSGTSLTNVNGRAVSIEMLFGEELLRAGARGELPAVTWSWPVDGTEPIQGSIGYKRGVQRAIQRELSPAHSLADLNAGAAKGCSLVAAMLLEAAMTARPLFSTERSPLLKSRLDAAVVVAES
jgi:hypothetical protein